jgi:hypothetical protein
MGKDFADDQLNTYLSYNPFQDTRPRSNIVIPSSNKHPKTLIRMKNLGSHSSFLTDENLLQSNSII